MANDWIKMRSNLWDHPKVVRIVSALCPQNVRDLSARCKVIGALYRTWALADTHTEDGILDGYCAESLDIAVGIDGWTVSLELVGWLSVDAQRIIVPRFTEHNGNSAKRRAEDSERKKRVRKMSAKCPQNVRDKPAQKETEKRREEKRREEQIHDEQSSSAVEANPIVRVANYYRSTYHPRWCPDFTSKAKEWSLIKARLADGYTVDDLLEAIDGCHRSPHHCGENATGAKYQSLELIVRDSKHVADFIEKLGQADQPVLSQRTQANIRAGQSYLDRVRKELADKNNNQEVIDVEPS